VSWSETHGDAEMPPIGLYTSKYVKVNIIYKRAQWSEMSNQRRKRIGVKWIGMSAGSSGS